MNGFTPDEVRTLVENVQFEHSVWGKDVAADESELLECMIPELGREWKADQVCRDPAKVGIADRYCT